MPMLARRGAMSAQAFGFARRTAVGLNYWIDYFGETSHNYVFNDIAIDSVGKAVVVGYCNYAPINGSSSAIIAEFNADGTVTNGPWRLEYGASTQGWGIALDAANNRFLRINATGAGAYASLVKLAADGSTFMGGSRSTTETNAWQQPGGVVYSALNDKAYWLAGAYSSSYTMIGKRSTASGTDGAGVYSHFTQAKGYTANLYDMCEDPATGMLYVSGNNTYPGTQELVFKMNPAGTYFGATAYWQRSMGSSSQAVRIRFDPVSSRVITLGQAYNGNYVAHLSKYNPANAAGSILAPDWEATLKNAATPNKSLFGNGMTLDSVGNIYICGSNNNDSNGFIAKYDPSGALIWQRTLSASNRIWLSSIALKGTDLFVCGYYTADGTHNSGFVAKLPTDGTKTGTYGAFTYAVASYYDDHTSTSNSANQTTISMGQNGSLTSGSPGSVLAVSSSPSNTKQVI